jgi:hypothetical protein
MGLKGGEVDIKWVGLWKNKNKSKSRNCGFKPTI